MSDSARRARAAAIAAWLVLAASIACWPFAGVGIGWISSAIAFTPLLLPLPGLVRGSFPALRASPMALTPALALAITEILANPAGRPWVGATLILVLLAFAAVLAALRRAPRA